MNIYKLKFADKAEALIVLQEKGVLIPFEDEFIYGEGVQAVVELGLICIDAGTFDVQGEIITPPTLADGYHYDVMAEQNIDFGMFTITPQNPKHAFAGFEDPQSVENTFLEP